MQALISNIKQNPTETIKNLKKDKFKKLLYYLLEKYHNENTSLMSDQLFDYIKEYYEDRYGEIEEVGSEIKTDKIKLPYFLGSMNKLKKIKDMENWFNRYTGPYNISLKLDGLSGLLYKENNEVKLTTRGNGFEGQDKTNLLKYINVNVSNMKNGDYIRGELIMSKKNFLKIANEMKNPRNATSGIINSKTINEKNLKLVDFIAYAVIKPEMIISEQMNYIKNIDMNCVYNINKNKVSLEELSIMFDEFRNTYKYEIDGLIITDNSKIYPLIEGENPKYSFAFKKIMTDQQAETIVLDVIWTIQKDAYITPKIRIEPIELLGSTIEYATAHNAKFIQENNIGVGSKIVIIKSGDVIPKIHKILSSSDLGEPLMPKVKAKWDDTNTHLIATEIDDDQEQEIIIKQLAYTFDKLDVANFSEATIAKLVENGYNTFWKILKADKNDLTSIDGLSTKSVNKIYDNIENSLHKIELHDLMNASICFGRSIGSKKIKSILDIHPNIIDIYKEKDKDYTYELIKNIKGFEDKTTSKIVEGFDCFIKWIEKLIKIKPYVQEKLIPVIKKEEVIQENKFKDKKICFSGFRNKELENKLIKLGGMIVSTISKNTNFLIVKDINESSSKIDKAKELGIEIIENTSFD